MLNLNRKKIAASILAGFFVCALVLFFSLFSAASAATDYASSGFSLFDASKCTGPVVAGVPDATPQCTLCDLLKVTENFINYALFIAIPIAVIFIIMGGFYIMTATGSSDRYQQGRKIITAAAIGLAITLGAWIIVDEVISLLAQGTFNLTWWKIDCVSEKGGGTTTSTPISTATPTPTPASTLACSASSNSPQLDQVIACVQQGAAARGLSLTGQITTFQGSHTCNLDSSPPNISCHYGGRFCNGTAHAADFPLIPSQRNAANWATLRQIGADCQTSASRCEKGSAPYITSCSDPAVNHIHVNDSISCGCN